MAQPRKSPIRRKPPPPPFLLSGTVIGSPEEVAVEPQAAPTARQGAERVLASAAAVSRLVALVYVLSDVVASPWHINPPIEAAAFLAVIAESAILVTGCLRAGVLRRRWALADAVALAALLAACDLPWATGGVVGISPLYNFCTLAILVVGFADWSLVAALGAAGIVAAANVGTAAFAGESLYPLWNAGPDSVALLVAAAVAWVIARVLRESSRALDAHRESAVQRTVSLAGERERMRHGQALGVRLLSSLEEVAASPDALDPALRDQVNRELAWLRMVSASSSTEPAGYADGASLADPHSTASGDADHLTALAVPLHALAAEKAAVGLRVHLALPATGETSLMLPEHVAALVCAAREALTNVAKHAGTDQAEVRVRTIGGSVEVEIADSGRGYDTRQHPPGTGQRGSIRQRLVEVGGGAAIDSRPGRGTTVRLWIPQGGTAGSR
jgi:signal transduction histidine kinase